MKLDIIEQNDTLELKIAQTIDSTSAPELEAVLKEKLEGKTKVIFDLKELKYMSSAGLRVLLATHKKMAGKGTAVIRNVNESVAEIFDVTGFSSILNIE